MLVVNGHSVGILAIDGAEDVNRLFVEAHGCESERALRARVGPLPLPMGAGPGHRSKELSPLVAEILAVMRPGDRMKGRVGKIVDYGAFIDLGKVTGLLHVSAIPGAVKGSVEKLLETGQEIEVEVLDVEVDRQRLSLGIPAAEKAGAVV